MKRRELLKGLLCLPALIAAKEVKSEVSKSKKKLDFDNLCVYSWPGSPGMKVFVDNKEISRVTYVLGSYFPKEEIYGAVEYVVTDTENNFIIETINEKGVCIKSHRGEAEFLKRQWLFGMVRWEPLFNEGGIVEFEGVTSKEKAMNIARSNLFGESDGEFYIPKRFANNLNIKVDCVNDRDFQKALMKNKKEVMAMISSSCRGIRR
jgi:hypothetical protein